MNLINLENALPTPPNLFAEIVLLFDHDFPIEQVNARLGLNPTESKRQFQTRINPMTQEKNPGFWLFQTEVISSFDIKPLLQMIDNFLSAHSTGLHEVIQQYSPSCFILRIRVLVQQEDEYPSIRLDPEILQRLSSFNASIEIDVDNDFILSVDKPEEISIN